MTLTILLFIAPEAWPTYLSLGGLLIALGGGKASLDRLARIA